MTSWRIECSAPDHSASTDTVVYSIAEVQALVAQMLLPDSVLIVTTLKDGADYGEFLIFLNAMELAYVRLLEHRGFYATRTPRPTGRTVQFVEDARPFEVDENATIPRDAAVAALDYWLSTGQQFPGVCWSGE